MSTPQPVPASSRPGGSSAPGNRKAVVLISGGLDSMLAARLMLDQGIHVEGINFYTGFCVEGHTHAIRREKCEEKWGQIYFHGGVM